MEQIGGKSSNNYIGELRKEATGHGTVRLPMLMAAIKQPSLCVCWCLPFKIS